MSSTEIRESLKYKSWMHNKIGVNQIYSPSGLYSILIHKDILEGKSKFTMEEVFVLNNSTLEVQHYKFMDKAWFEKSNMVSRLYWVCDLLLVSIMIEEGKIIQRTFAVDHTYCSIKQVKERPFHVKQDKLAFAIDLAFYIFDKSEFIVLLSLLSTVPVAHSRLQMIPKNPFSEDVLKEYYLQMKTPDEVRDLINSLNIRNQVFIGDPFMSVKNKLFCSLLKFDGNNDRTIFGIYLVIYVEKLERVTGDNPSVQDIIDRQDDDVWSYACVSKPENVAAIDFYKAIDSCVTMDKIWTLPEQTEENSVLKVVNCTTMDLIRYVVPKEKSAVLTIHPSGFILQWFIFEDKIEFKKINIPMKLNSLEEISRRSILYNTQIQHSNIRGIQQFLFPRSKIIEKRIKPILNAFLITQLIIAIFVVCFVTIGTVMII